MLILGSVIAPLLASQVALVAALPHRGWQSASTDVGAGVNTDVDVPTHADGHIHWGRPRPTQHHSDEDEDEDNQEDNTSDENGNSGDDEEDSGDNNEESEDNDDGDEEPSISPVPTSTGGDDDEESSTTAAPVPPSSTSGGSKTETKTPTVSPTATPTTPPPQSTAPATGSGITNLPPDAKFDYQIGGPYTPASDVKVVSRDMSADPVEDLYNICYINAFQTQPADKDFWTGQHDALLLRTKSGEYFEDPDWEGEFFLDTSSADKRTQLATIVNGWIDECARKGFQAIEPDNLDTYTRSDDLLTEDDNIAFAKLFTEYAHSKGLAVAQKNTGRLGTKGKDTAGFDFAVAEECQAWKECDTYTDVYGDRVVEIEYTDNDDARASFETACKNQGSSISVSLRDRLVKPQGDSAYTYEEC